MSYYFSSLLTEKAKHSKTFLIIKSSTFKGLIRQEDIVVIGQFCAYCILSNRLNTTDVCLKIGSFDPAFSRAGHLIRVRRLLMKCNSLSLFQVDLLLLILRDPGAVCQVGWFYPLSCPRNFKDDNCMYITHSYSIRVPYILMCSIHPSYVTVVHLSF